MIYKNTIKKLTYTVFKNKLKQIEFFRNIHLNEECYLFGDGPSIKWFDLNNFTNKISFSAGKIYYHNDFQKLNLKYISLAEPYYFSPFFLMTHKKSGGNFDQTRGKIILNKDPLISDLKNKILSFKDKDIFLNLSNLPFFLNKKNITYLFREIPNFNIMKILYDNNYHPFGGSLNFALMILIYMGFKKIYLIGFDYYFNQPISGHWFENGPGIKINLDHKKNKLFFKIISKFTELVLITKNSNSNLINSIEYSDLYDNEYSYRENTDICSGDNLKKFDQSGWHSYRIFNK